MEIRKDFMKSRGKFIHSCLLLLSLLITGGETLTQAGQSTISLDRSPGTFQLDVGKGYLSLEANQAPLVQIFQEIGKQARITFERNVGPEEKITIHLGRVPVEDGIKQLAKNVTVFYTENPKDKTHRIERVVVLSERKESAPRQTKASLEPAKIDN